MEATGMHPFCVPVIDRRSSMPQDVEKGKSKREGERRAYISACRRHTCLGIYGPRGAESSSQIRGLHRVVDITYDPNCPARLSWSNHLSRRRSSLYTRATRRIFTRKMLSPAEVSPDSCASHPWWYVRSPAGPRSIHAKFDRLTDVR